MSSTSLLTRHLDDGPASHQTHTSRTRHSISVSDSPFFAETMNCDEKTGRGQYTIVICVFFLLLSGLTKAMHSRTRRHVDDPYGRDSIFDFDVFIFFLHACISCPVQTLSLALRSSPSNSHIDISIHIGTLHLFFLISHLVHMHPLIHHPFHSLIVCIASTIFHLTSLTS